MISHAALEEATLALLCFSEIAPMIAVKVTPTLFSNKTHRKLAESALGHIKKFGTPPAGALEYLLEADMRRGEEGKLLGQTFDFLAKQAGNIDTAFVLGELDQFIEFQKMNKNLQEAMDALNDGDLEKAREVVYNSATITEGKEASGIWLSDSTRMLAALDSGREEFFSCGIEAFDTLGVELERKTLSFLIAPAKAGKSWYLIQVGKMALQHHHSVLHITNEISQEMVARRYLQSMFALTKSEAKQIKTAYFEMADGHMQIKFREVVRDSIIAKKETVRKKLNEMKSFPRLLIKEYPTGYLSTEELLIYLQRLEREDGFIPDVIIIDYADLMKIDSATLRVDTGRLYRDLRGIAGVRNAVMVSATQGNRASSTARVVDVNMVGEDWSKIGTADLVLTFSRTPEEKQIGLARVMVAAARNVEDRMLALVSQSYQTGQFAIDSTIMNMDVSHEVEALAQRPTTN